MSAAVIRAHSALACTTLISVKALAFTGLCVASTLSGALHPSVSILDGVVCPLVCRVCETTLNRHAGPCVSHGARAQGAVVSSPRPHKMLVSGTTVHNSVNLTTITMVLITMLVACANVIALVKAWVHLVPTDLTPVGVNVVTMFSGRCWIIVRRNVGIVGTVVHQTGTRVAGGGTCAGAGTMPTA